MPATTSGEAPGRSRPWAAPTGCEARSLMTGYTPAYVRWVQVGDGGFRARRSRISRSSMLLRKSKKGTASHKKQPKIRKTTSRISKPTLNP